MMENDDVPPELEEVVVPIANDKKVPVTIITGFLGAGKTTFLNYVLTARHGKKIAVIQNEFGIETGADAAVVFGKDGTKSLEYFELPNGCVCCSVRGDLVLTIENLMQKKEKFDYVFIEPSGLADPGPLASTFWLDDELESDLYLDSIVTIVDAKHFKQHLDEEKPAGVINEAQRQVAFADRIIVNKIDLVAVDYLEALERQILSHNSAATIVRATRAEVDLDSILNINAFDMTRALDVDPHLKSSCCSDAEKAGDHEHAHTHLHDDSVVTVNFTVEGDLELDKLKAWLADLLWEEKGNDIFRMKGIISIKDEPTKYALQSVHSLFDLERTGIEWRRNTPGEKEEVRATTMVVIGRHLDQHQLASSLRAILS
jgi:G3E family GTPase